jgi:membrane protein
LQGSVVGIYDAIRALLSTLDIHVSFRNAWSLLRQTVAEWLEDKAPQLGAALAFYTALSIAPLLVLALVAAGYFLGADAARGQIAGQLDSLIGDAGSEAIEDMLASAHEPKAGSIAAVFGFITLLFGASGVFGQLQDALNTIWEVKPKAGRGFFGMIRDRFLSFAMVMGIVFLLLASLLVTAALSSIGQWASQLPDSLQWAAHAVNVVVSFAVITLLFAMMFKVLPDVKIAWSDVWLGAAVTALLFTIGKFAIGLYLGQSSMASAYGVAGSFVVLLVWVYYSAQIMFFGAELTQVYANRHGSGIVPTENAEPVTEADRA